LIKAPKMDDKALRRALRILRNAEPDTTKILRSEMSSALLPVAQRVAAAMPARPALSNFAWSPGYGVAKGTVSTVPSRTRKSGNKLITIKVASTRTDKTKGLLLAEFGGTRSSGDRNTGRAMIKNLNRISQIRRGEGRFAYPAFRNNRKETIKVATEILEKFMKKASRSI
jgi:hypothetical protein